MPTIDEQRALQLQNAKTDADRWNGIESLHATTAADHKKLIASAERVIENSEAEAANAAAIANAAKDRIARLERGEDVEGGLAASPNPFSDEAMVAAGFTRRDLRRMRLLAEVRNLGKEVWKVLERSMHASDHLDRAAEREARACLKLFGAVEDPIERAEIAREMCGPASQGSCQMPISASVMECGVSDTPHLQDFCRSQPRRE